MNRESHASPTPSPSPSIWNTYNKVSRDTAHDSEGEEEEEEEGDAGAGRATGNHPKQQHTWSGLSTRGQLSTLSSTLSPSVSSQASPGELAPPYVFACTEVTEQTEGRSSEPRSQAQTIEWGRKKYKGRGGRAEQMQSEWERETRECVCVGMRNTKEHALFGEGGGRYLKTGW
jgi:hypothetical protein